MNLYFISLNKELAYNIALEYSKKKNRTFINIQKMIELKFKKSFDFDSFSKTEIQQTLGYEVGLHQFYGNKEDMKNSIMANPHTSYMLMPELNKNGAIIYLKEDLTDVMANIINFNNVEDKDKEMINKIVKSVTNMDTIYNEHSDIIIDTASLSEEEILNKIPYLSI